MAKVKILENFRVEVEPTINSYMQRTPVELERAYRSECQRIKNEIDRHVDGLHKHAVSIAFDAKDQCSLCGRTWDTDESGVPWCCDAAVAEFEKQQSSAQQMECGEAVADNQESSGD
jgi:hypothetical protein